MTRLRMTVLALAVVAGQSLANTPVNTGGSDAQFPLSVVNPDFRGQDGSELTFYDNGQYLLGMDCGQRSAVVFAYAPWIEPAGQNTNVQKRYAFRSTPELAGCEQASGDTYQSEQDSYDRGHLVPHNHFDESLERVRNTYLRANMLPQQASFNRSGAWKRTEKITECLRENEQVWVAGGPLWAGVHPLPADYVTENTALQPHDVIVPDAFWKVVWTTTGYDAWVMGNTRLSNHASLEGQRVDIQFVAGLLNGLLHPDYVNHMTQIGQADYSPMSTGCDET